MSAKTIAIALVLAATTGAAANYVQNNPDSVRQLWAQATEFRGPLASSDENRRPKAYRRTAFYNLCKRGFARKLRNRSSRERDVACTCMDREIAGWTKAKRDNVSIAFSQIAFDYGIDSRVSSAQPRSPHRLSQHDRNVREAWARQNQHNRAREMAVVAEHYKSVERKALNPVVLLWTVKSIEGVAGRCGILQRQRMPSNMKEIEERYQNIGASIN